MLTDVLTSTVYLHAVKWPLFANFSAPEKYGLARTLPVGSDRALDTNACTAGKTLNLQLTTSDNVTLGAWFILSDRFYHNQVTQPTPEILSSLVPTTLRTHPTVLFLHGNAATRAVRFRIQIYSALSARFGANVLALDYRGFGDSGGKPSEAGLTRDVRAAWNWLVQQGADPADILVLGHSLGTGVGARFVYELQSTGVKPRGLALLAPFSSIHTLLDTYYLFGLVPLVKPIELIPGAKRECDYECIDHDSDTK